ncbi:hypothetical protein F0562_008211 [Nyssa sinensis]|uniref:Uncharacterized protein n=1 Tax=Nyssa sinensis TaxID=561372 RepID=A0A5J5A9U6_9ASTE|nr:hypothetical protein F0562_008211 [Nyssa sinensis]
MNSAIISKVSGPPGKFGGSSTSFDSFDLFLKYPLFENSGYCKIKKKQSRKVKGSISNMNMNRNRATTLGDEKGLKSTELSFTLAVSITRAHERLQNST